MPPQTPGKPATARTGPLARDDDGPVLPTKSKEDTDAGWGEAPGPKDDDERLCRERPPHWDSA